MHSRAGYGRNVLIGFVTKSDPESPRGLANIATALKALVPNVVYLLHTSETAENYNRLKAWIGQQQDLETVAVSETPLLELPDATDYFKLYEVLVYELKRIETNHRYAHFHMVSGLPQARIIFALCIDAGLPRSATLYEVNTPPGQTMPSSREGWRQRLEDWPISIFADLRQLYDERTTEKRLELMLPNCTAYLDGVRLDLRQRRRFVLLLLLAARKQFGEGRDTLTKEFLRKTLFRNVANEEQRIPEAIRQVNQLSEKISRDNLRLIIPPELGKTRGGEYQLNNALGYRGEAIKLPPFRQLRQFLVETFQDHIEELADLLPGLELDKTTSNM